jgi:hypothetical protein
LKALTKTKPYGFTGCRRPGTFWRASRLLLLFVALICGLAPAASLVRGQSSGTTGYEVKTAFLFNFVKFIDWPASSFAGLQSPFTICILGQDPFGNTLDDTLLGKIVGGRPLVIRRLKDKTEARSCQMIFVSASESAHLPEIFATLQRANVLFIGETAGFAASGGTIEFTFEENHVRFTINTDAADRSGLIISSKLLALAKIVHDQPHMKGG